MPRLCVCPQRHVWTSADDGDDSSSRLCPICGMQGLPATAAVTSANGISETLSPALVPPVVPDVTLIYSRPAPRADDDLIPSVPGYDLLRELGRGGMGVVYLARHRELKRLVALKMILAGAHADPATRARFRREAEAIARLQHPGIVQIHDVGEHDRRPYLALEYVEGSDLSYQMTWGGVAPRTAASLIEALARIVQHAHDRGIVHRDLTPRNVLLAPTTSVTGFSFDASGQCFEAKITDFGLAKELDVDAAQTQTGVVVGTPSYMAPEQARGRPQEVGAPADIYALGAILYEMLARRPPFVAETAHETLTQVVEADPIPPTRLQSRTPRDLETICLKCLHKDPHRRYATATDLADDLHRFLANEPIRARPVSRRERVGKWIRRHPAVTGLLAVVCASLLAIVIGGVLYNAQLRHERDRAEASLELALRSIEQMLSEVGEVHLAIEPHMEEKRRVLLTKALALHQELLLQRSDDARVRYSTAQAFRRMGDILRLLGQHDESLAAYDEALSLLRTLLAESPDNVDYLQQMAHCRNFQGEVHRAAARYGEAESAYRDASKIQSPLVAAFPNVPAYRQDLARTRYNLGIVLRESRRPAEAERELLASTDLLGDLVNRFPNNPEHQQHLARAYLNMGTVIRSPDRRGEAQAAYDHAIDILRPLTTKYPEQPDYRHELGVALNNAGNLKAKANELDEARALHVESRSLFRALAADFPKVPVYRQELANTCNSIGNVDYGKQDFKAAVSDWSEAAKLLEALLADRKNEAVYQGDLGMVLGNLGLAYHKLSRLPEARDHLQRSIDRLKVSLTANADNTVYQDALRDSLQNLAEVLVLSRDHAAAARAARSLAGAVGAAAQDRYYAACFLSRCAGLAEVDAKLPPEQRQELVTSYSDDSVAALRDAMHTGFDEWPRINADRDTLLKAVAQRQDFESLVDELRKRTDSTP